MSALYKTKGIVLKNTKFKETSVITSIYTEMFGLQTYIVKGARSKTAKGKMALLQPLTLLDMVVYHKLNSDINHISEFKCFQPYTSLPISIKKSAIAMFLNEMLCKTIKESHENAPLFQFISNSLQIFDHLNEQATNFHLQFLIKLPNYLGYAFNKEWLQLQKGQEEEKRSIFEHILSLGANSYDAKYTLSTIERRKVLQEIISFYRIHNDHFGEIKSIEVLKDVLQ